MVGADQSAELLIRDDLGIDVHRSAMTLQCIFRNSAHVVSLDRVGAGSGPCSFMILATARARNTVPYLRSSPITPVSVLRHHADDELADLTNNPRSAGSPGFASVIFLSDYLAEHSKSSSLIVGESERLSPTCWHTT